MIEFAIVVSCLHSTLFIQGKEILFEQKLLIKIFFFFEDDQDQDQDVSLKQEYDSFNLTLGLVKKNRSVSKLLHVCLT